MGKNKPNKKPPAPRQAHRAGNSFSEGASSRSRTVASGLSTPDLLALTYVNSPQKKHASSSLLVDYASTNLLLVGEGDFSFAKALVAAFASPSFKPPGTTSNSLQVPKICATSLDTLAQCGEKYGGKVSKTVLALTNKGHRVLHGVDATKLSSRTDLGEKFERIVFNFPHISGASSQAEDAKQNQRLLLKFFKESKAVSKNNGRVIVSLRSTPFYDSWDIESLANKAGWVLAKPKQPFPGDIWLTLGYAPVRTNPAVREAPSLEGAFNHVFRLARPGEIPDADSEDDEDDDDAEEKANEVEEEPKEAQPKPKANKDKYAMFRKKTKAKPEAAQTPGVKEGRIEKKTKKT